MTDSKNDKIYALADIAALAQTEFQRNYSHIDPVIGIMRSMRDAGFAADALTIDCITSGKRILFILHDSAPDTLDYLFGYRDKDPDMVFEKIALTDATKEQFYAWMEGYFLEGGG